MKEGIFMDAHRIIFASIGGYVAAWIGHVWYFVALTFVAIMLDYITGMIAGRANEGLNSKKATSGIWKKVGIIFLLFLGLFLDNAVNHFAADGIFFELPFSIPIAHIVTMWIVVTEAISVCENLKKLGVPIPAFMLSILKKAEKKISDEGSNTI
jgi:toxin secretion/phage lysis holin